MPFFNLEANGHISMNNNYICDLFSLQLLYFIICLNRVNCKTLLILAISLVYTFARLRLFLKCDTVSWSILLNAIMKCRHAIFKNIICKKTFFKTI